MSNYVFRCEQCGVDKPCVVNIIGANKIDGLSPPKFCLENGAKANWKLLS